MVDSAIKITSMTLFALMCAQVFSLSFEAWVEMTALINFLSFCLAVFGVKLAFHLNVPQLKSAFAEFLFLVGLKMTLI